MSLCTMDMPLDALTDASDDALLVLFANGDQSAATALTQRLPSLVLAHAYRLLGDRSEAEDVT
jgi:DNA-directed RNA polymerase specialized sigma24 family protein